MPTTGNGLIPALGLLLQVRLGGAVRPAIEPGCYEGRVDPSRPIGGNLYGIAMNVSWGASEGRKPVTSMQFRVEKTQPTFEVVDVGRIEWAATACLSCKQLELGPGEISEVQQCYRPIRWSREAAQALHRLYDVLTVNLTPETFSWPIRLSSVPSGQWYISLDQFTGFPGHSVLRLAVLMEKKYGIPRVLPPPDRPKIGVAASPTISTPVGDPSPTSLARAGELPLGCFLNLNVVGRLTRVYLTLRSDTLGSPILGNLTISARPSSDAAKDTTQANVMAIRDMPLHRTPGYNNYVFAGYGNSTVQAEMDSVISAFGRSVGIDNLTLASVVLKRPRRRGQLLELQLGREGANSSRVILDHVYPIGYNPREVMPSCCGFLSTTKVHLGNTEGVLWEKEELQRCIYELVTEKYQTNDFGLTRTRQTASGHHQILKPDGGRSPRPCPST
ncbi:hypothetical protein FOZ61_007411 [Perkinsus olseni]|uniref:Uncharacterized protein n=1 Tax=Perkinsus olseni TaxID=32597 RepID=A0A7J6MPS2_PEROL|nr:hypothetical protein FOZ61_007411 [Perkinsus olseni]KAF4673575.1 hypothetical protein FOL46_006923 [Perkinsus olseni]